MKCKDPMQIGKEISLRGDGWGSWHPFSDGKRKDSEEFYFLLLSRTSLPTWISVVDFPPPSLAEGTPPGLLSLIVR